MRAEAQDTHTAHTPTRIYAVSRMEGGRGEGGREGEGEGEGEGGRGGVTSGNIGDDLSFHQREADTIMLSVYAVLRSSGHSRCRGRGSCHFIQYPWYYLHEEKERVFFFCRAMCSDEDITKCLIPLPAVMPTAVSMVMARRLSLKKW
jgi:hypothetical protein